MGIIMLAHVNTANENRRNGDALDTETENYVPATEFGQLL